MELRTPSEDVETPETSHDRKLRPKLKSKGEEMVFLEPSEGWGSGGHSYVRTGDPEQEAVRRKTPSCFLLQPPSSVPLSPTGGTWSQATWQSLYPRPVHQ